MVFLDSAQNKISLIDIESDGAPCSSQIRIAYTIPASGNYGNTFYQTGSWSDNTAPSWIEAPVSVHAEGTSPQASFWTGPALNPYIGIGGSSYTYITPVFFASNVGSIAESVELLSGKAFGKTNQCPSTQ